MDRRIWQRYWSNKRKWKYENYELIEFEKGTYKVIDSTNHSLYEGKEM